MSIERRTLDVKDAAQMIGISLPRMYDLVHSKGFPKIQIGRRIVIPTEKFFEWINKIAEST